MQIIQVLVVSLAFVAVSFAGDDEPMDAKRTRIMNFYKCLSCTQDPIFKEEFQKCHMLKPEKSKKMGKECYDELMQGHDTEDKMWNAFCKNEHDELEKMFECIIHHQDRKEMDEDDWTKLKEYIDCSKKLDAKFCKH